MARQVLRGIMVVGLTYTVLVIALSVVNVVAPQRNGLLALSQILAPLLFVPLLPLAVVGVTFRRYVGPPSLARSTAAALFACILVAGFRFGSNLPPQARPPTDGSRVLGVTSWNLEMDATPASSVREVLQDAPTGVVGLVELSPATAAAISEDSRLADRFPTQLLHPFGDARGIGLLSTYPAVGAPSIVADPPMLSVDLDLGGGHLVSVLVAHPFPGTLAFMGPVPIDFDASRRDRRIHTIRGSIDALMNAGKPLITLGDFNTTDREPAYGELSADLVDVHRAVGFGLGGTWRPDDFKWLPFGLLRIDMVFTGPGADPLSILSDCTPRGSDHCIVRAAVEVP